MIFFLISCNHSTWNRWILKKWFKKILEKSQRKMRWRYDYYDDVIIRSHFACKFRNEQLQIQRRKMLDAFDNILQCLVLSFELEICITKVNAFLHIFLHSHQCNRHFLTLFNLHLLAKNNVQYYVQFTSTKKHWMVNVEYVQDSIDSIDSLKK